MLDIVYNNKTLNVEKGTLVSKVLKEEIKRYLEEEFLLI